MKALLIGNGRLGGMVFEPYMEVIKGLGPNYYGNVYLIGIVAVVSGILLAIPKTFTFWIIATLVFLGGTISAHMQVGDNFTPHAVFVLLTAITSYLKRPECFKIKEYLTNA